MGLISRVSSRTYRHTMADKVAKLLEIKTSNPDNITAAVFDEEFYNSLDEANKADFLKCLNSGIENEDSGMGCYACQPNDYERFKPFFQAALEKYHKVDLSKKSHKNNWSLEGVEGLPADGKLDLTNLGLPELSMRVRTGRNLKKFPMPGGLESRGQSKYGTSNG